MMTEALKGKSVKEAQTIFHQFHKLVTGELDPQKDEHILGKLAIFSGIWHFPARVKCATLAWHAVKGAVDKEAVASTEKKKSDSLDVTENSEIPLFDLSGVACPINFVKIKVRLSKMEIAEKLKVILDDGEPINW